MASDSNFHTRHDYSPRMSCSPMWAKGSCSCIVDPFRAVVALAAVATEAGTEASGAVKAASVGERAMEVATGVMGGG